MDRRLVSALSRHQAAPLGRADSGLQGEALTPRSHLRPFANTYAVTALNPKSMKPGLRPPVTRKTIAQGIRPDARLLTFSPRMRLAAAWAYHRPWHRRALSRPPVPFTDVHGTVPAAPRASCRHSSAAALCTRADGCNDPRRRPRPGNAGARLGKTP